MYENFVSKNTSDRIPIVIEYRNAFKKFNVSSKTTLTFFREIIRKNLQLNSASAFYIMVENDLVPSNYILSELYKLYKDDDGFLYMNIYEESAFG